LAHPVALAQAAEGCRADRATIGSANESKMQDDAEIIRNRLRSPKIRGVPHSATPLILAKKKVTLLYTSSINRMLAQHYGVTDGGLDFIINDDFKYRVGRGANGAGDDET
jgi:hypothetical protein